MRVIFERTRDPSKNLKKEEALFRAFESGRARALARFWIDSPCLVRGKARNAKYGWYREAVAKKLGVKVVTRATGGGVVYHDGGNLNWSLFLKSSGRIIAPLQMFQEASAPIVRALVSLGVPAEFAPPNRIDAAGHKISGMAARSSPKARLVHGTLLIDADLGKLDRLCIPPPGCPPVANLSKWTGPIKSEKVVRAAAKALEGSRIGGSSHLTVEGLQPRSPRTARH